MLARSFLRSASRLPKSDACCASLGLRTLCRASDLSRLVRSTNCHDAPHSTSRRSFQTSAVALVYRGGRPRKNIVTTLNPANLIAGDYTDLSGREIWQGRMSTEDGESEDTLSRFSVKYRKTGTDTSVPFPPDTRGFFYYQPAPHASQPLGGQLRFRVTNDPNPSSFASGHDLLHDIERVPWGIPGLALMRSKSRTEWGYGGLTSLLLRDGYVDTALKEACESGLHRIQKDTTLYLKLGQKFYLDFQRERYIWLTTGDRIQKISVGHFTQPAPGQKSYPFKGSAHVCFEKYKTEEGYPAAAIRVLKIWDPVEENPTLEPHSLVRPQEGLLLMKKSGVPVLRLTHEKPGGPGAALLAST